MVRLSALGSRLSAVALALVIGSAASAQTQLVIVSGLGGDPKYTATFAELSTTLARAARERARLPDSAITWLAEERAPGAPWLRGVSLSATVERTLTTLASRMGRDEQLVLVLIGHGGGEGDATRISLPGADLTARDFARLLDAFGRRRIAFVNLTSGSGDMLSVLAAPGRVVITATKSAFERNASQFARYFVDALAKDGADTDKDGQVSVLEAFRYAEAETKRFYDTAGRLATEHAQLADADELARRFFVTPGTMVAAGGNARLAALYAEKAALDERIEALRKRKSEMSRDSYEQELERLMLSLAQTAQEIRKLERGS